LAVGQIPASTHSSRGRSEGDQASAVSNTASTGCGMAAAGGFDSAWANTTYTRPTPNMPAAIGQ
jgi:hypothetical protein